MCLVGCRRRRRLYAGFLGFPKSRRIVINKSTVANVDMKKLHDTNSSPDCAMSTPYPEVNINTCLVNDRKTIDSLP